MNNIDLFCIYRSSVGREVEFNYLINKTETIDYEDLTAANFSNIMGGLRIVDGYKTIFLSTNFYTLIEIVSFLIHSLYWIKNLESDVWNEFDEFPFCAVINTMSVPREHLILRRYSDKGLNLSFLSIEPKTVKERGDFYFVDEIISEEAWIKAVNIALEEYFFFVQKIIHNDPNHHNSIILLKYFNSWKRINNVHA